MVVPAAKQRQVVGEGGTAIRPMLQMVAVSPRRRPVTTWEATAAVASDQRPGRIDGGITRLVRPASTWCDSAPRSTGVIEQSQAIAERSQQGIGCDH